MTEAGRFPAVMLVGALLVPALRTGLELAADSEGRPRDDPIRDERAVYSTMWPK